MKLCLNMIVKNEAANLPRCLNSVLPHISCWAIADTGSVDHTRSLVRETLGARPGALAGIPFENFEQARNAALDLARSSPLDFDYLLLIDADMELIVEPGHALAGFTSPAYCAMQRAATGLSWQNVRFLRRDVPARYVGVTHEFLQIDNVGIDVLDEGVWFKDHQSGANRKDKYVRDIALLNKALAKEPDNTRNMFYLAQSYRGAGYLLDAAAAYRRRAEMGGWEEEVWYCMLAEARCYRMLGADAEFYRAALAAYSRRPTRAEPLHDLVVYCRSRGMIAAAQLFAEARARIPLPTDDVLFVEQHIYGAAP